MDGVGFCLVDPKDVLLEILRESSRQPVSEE